MGAQSLDDSSEISVASKSRRQLSALMSPYLSHRWRAGRAAAGGVGACQRGGAQGAGPLPQEAPRHPRHDTEGQPFFTLLHSKASCTSRAIKAVPAGRTEALMLARCN